MIYILLESKNDYKNNEYSIQSKIIDFIRKKIRYRYTYEFIFCNTHILDESLEKINKENDIILWNPMVAYNNLTYVNQFKNSIVILDKPTVYLQKISKNNPINENTAINNGFYIFYLKDENIDITNNEYKIVVNETMYKIDFENLKKLIESYPENIIEKDSTENIDILEIDNNIKLNKQITLE